MQYYAAYKAFLGVQRYTDSEKMFELYKRKMAEARMSSMPSLVANWYGRS